MERPIIKYLDPITGQYEFSTVVDIGDLDKLNTRVKTNIVESINSLISDILTNGAISDEDLARLVELEKQIGKLKDGTFEIDNFDAIDNYLYNEMISIIDGINASNREEMDAVMVELSGFVDNAIDDYNARVVAQNELLLASEKSMTDAQKVLDDKAKELEMANIGLSELEFDFNELDGYITSNIKSIDFDNFNALLGDYESVVTQTSSEVGTDLSGSTLSYLSGRVTDAHNSLSIQADEIMSRMRYDEMQYIPMRNFDYNENLLFNTIDFHDDWERSNGASVNTDAFLFGRVMDLPSNASAVSTITDDLVVGETYTLSTYVNIQPKVKEPNAEKYEPISDSYNVSSFSVQIGSNTYNPIIYENISGVNGWVRVYQQFVAEEANPTITIRPTGVNNSTHVSYMALPKLEKGLAVTPYQPHVDDEYATLLSTQSTIKRQAGSIVSLFEKTQELDDTFVHATSTFEQLAEGFRTNTSKLEQYEDELVGYHTSYENINGMFESKVWKEDFTTLIDDVNIDNRNRVLNSDFIRHEIDANRNLVVENWTLNQDWSIKDIDGVKYLSRERTGLSNVLNTTATSDYFPIRNGEKVLFGFELLHSGLDNDTVFSLEFFNLSNTRLLKKEFKLSELTKNGNRYTGLHTLNTNGVEKARVVLQLPKNGLVNFTHVSVQNADIGSTDWQPAPEDSWIIQSRMQTRITQLNDEIFLGATGQKINALSGLIEEDESGIRLSPEKIASNVTSTDVFNDLGLIDSTNFEQTAQGWLQTITSDGRLSGAIEAMPNQYKISFDRIHLDGTTWANALGSSKIYVTEQFALMGLDGKPVLNVGNDGNIEMNVNKLTIGAAKPLLETDKDDIVSDVTDNVIDRTEPYIHFAYADDISGNGISFSPVGKKFMGVMKSNLPTPSGNKDNYTWSRYVGNDGHSSYLHIAWAYSPLGDGFSTTDSTDRYYMGTYVDNLEADSNNYLDYEWIKVKGDDLYKTEVLSTQGNAFKNGIIDTWLYAVVYKGTKDVTADIDANRFRWTRTSSDTNADIAWNNKYFGGAKEIKITIEDVYHRATFTCDILQQNGDD